MWKKHHHDKDLWWRFMMKMNHVYKIHQCDENKIFDESHLRNISSSLWPKLNILMKMHHHYCHSLVLIPILISIKTRSDNIFGPKPPTPPHPPTHPPHPPGTQLCLILTKLLIFEVHHQNKRYLSILEESKNDVRLSWC